MSEILSPFPSHIAFVCRESQGQTPSMLHPDEVAVISTMANDKRRREFSWGRALAHEAIRQLGIPDRVSILPGSRREPIWPDGLVGSLTHCGQLVACAVGLKGQVRGLGIDLESLQRAVASSLSRRVAGEDEIPWIVRNGERDAIRRSIQLFSAKESVFKALYPIVKKYFGFQDAVIHWSEDESSFIAELRTDLGGEYGVGSRVAGGARVYAGTLLTWVIIPS